MMKRFVRLPAGPHCNDLRPSWMFINKFGKIVDSVLDDYPEIVFVVVLSYLIPAEVRIFIFVVTFGLAMRVLLMMMT